jgi:hypothetical protein
MPAQHLRRVNLIERQRDQSESEAVSSARALQRSVPNCSSLPPLTSYPPSRRRTRPRTSSTAQIPACDRTCIWRNSGKPASGARHLQCGQRGTRQRGLRRLVAFHRGGVKRAARASASPGATSPFVAAPPVLLLVLSGRVGPHPSAGRDARLEREAAGRSSSTIAAGASLRSPCAQQSWPPVRWRQ